MTTPNISGGVLTSPLPTIDEILSGATQGGVPKPDFLKDGEDDGSSERVNRPPDLRETGEI